MLTVELKLQKRKKNIQDCFEDISFLDMFWEIYMKREINPARKDNEKSKF